ncbi:MAG: GDP-mannose 4,6-dehydratase [Candidatus Pacebacteria bacterium]|jgi:UDP-glucuronate 4-epimerase|nr:GDP-mannose 4,6-dehydratase [Candidatus Paceibacterota bacterium]
MKKLLVTGGAGFIGSSVLHYLSDSATELVCVDNFDDTYNPLYKEQNIASLIAEGRITLYRVDITNQVELDRVFSETKPTHVLHLAAKADTRKAVELPHDYVTNNITGTLNILDACVKYNISQLVAASSSSVYGNNKQVPWREDNYALNPISPYGVTKLGTEHLAYSYAYLHKLPITMLRFFNVYGERNRPGMVPYIWAEAFLRGNSIEISGDGERRRDYTYIGDVVAGIIETLKQPREFEVVNIGHGSPLSLNELRELFERVTATTVPVVTRPSHQASVDTTFADTTKAKSLYGWSPQVSHEEGIERLLTWFRETRLEQ